MSEMKGFGGCIGNDRDIENGQAKCSDSVWWMYRKITYITIEIDRINDGDFCFITMYLQQLQLERPERLSLFRRLPHIGRVSILP